MTKILIILLVLATAIIAGLFVWPPLAEEENYPKLPENVSETLPDSTEIGARQPARVEKAANEFIPPLADYQQRIAKKPFGIYITPEISPVSPEKFSGYHTGVDLEILPGEEEMEVEVKTICSGELAVKQWVSGYGGVAVQSCFFDSQPVTVIYGHLDLNSIDFQIGKLIEAGNRLGLLGQGYSSETDGERKHLHLGIHRGEGINLKGYVSTASELSGWLDPESLF